jgi:hypothetical protein
MDTATSLAIASIVTTAGSIATLIITQHYQFKRAQAGLTEVKDAALTAASKVEKVAGTQDKKLDEIHVLVNSRLTTALSQIKALRRQLSKEQKKPKETRKTKHESPRPRTGSNR